MELNFFLLVIILVYIIVSIVVLVNIYKFDLRFYKFGITIFTKSFQKQSYNWIDKDGVYFEKSSRYVFIPTMKLGYFVTRFVLFNSYSLFSYSIGLPLTVFGEFYECEGRINIIYKIYFGVLIFPVLLLIFLLVYMIMAIFGGNLTFALIGLFFSGITFTVFYVLFQLQKSKFSIICDELQSLLK